jgi:bacillithiol biosynthesis cysteine-adding enzyme BshC
VDKLIEPSKALGYSDIYLDFVAGLHSARHFYAVDNIRDVAAQLDSISYDREAIADILARQNKTWGAGERTLASIEELRDPRAVCVFSGQQAGLFGGPLLVQIKAIAIIKAARKYSQKLGRPVVPIFWIAGDDHDFEEVNSVTVLHRQSSEPVTLTYSSPPEHEVPTAQIKFADADRLAEVKETLKETLGQSDFTPELYDLIDRCYTPDDTFVSGFGKFMSALTGQFGLVLFNPGDAEAKKLCVPFFHTILDKQDELHALINKANSHIVQHGYHIQVEKKDEAAHLFRTNPARTPVLRESDGTYSIGDETYSKRDLKELIEKEPERFSPDVMTRPVMQSYLFPVLSQKGGPAEIAYLAQINPIFPLFARIAPYHMARATATFVEKHIEKMMEQYEISFPDLTGDIEQVINRVLGETFPTDLEQRFSELQETVESEFQAFVTRSLQFDPQLESVANNIYGKIDYNLKQFEGKVFSAHKRKSGETRDRIYRIYNALYTNRGLQERSLNITYFLAKYGLDFMAFAYEQLDSEEQAHQLISMNEYGA